MDVNVTVNGANQNSAATQQDAVSNRKDKDEAAFAFANGCRDKEIDRFWSRGLYFWGFIAASFAAYMAVFALALGHDGEGQKALTLENILAMSYISRLTLFVLAFICFVFCLSWQLAHKASKYWQVNWEEYLISFEEKYLGQQIYGKPKNDNQKNYSVCPLSVEPMGLFREQDIVAVRDTSHAGIRVSCPVPWCLSLQGNKLFHENLLFHSGQRNGVFICCYRPRCLFSHGLSGELHRQRETKS